MRHALVVRLDSLGDVVVSGPAVRAVAAEVDRVTVLAGPLGADAARLLPGVDEVVVWDCPWILADPPPVGDLSAITSTLGGLGVTETLVLTSFHQSALPTALLLRQAGVPWVAAASEDYPGSLLDVRIAPPPPGPEPARMLAVANAAGYPGDDTSLRLRPPAAQAVSSLPPDYVVVHPGVSAPARAYPRWADVVTALRDRGIATVATGSPAEAALTAGLGADVDLGGGTDLGHLAAVLAGARAVAVANTGTAHVAAAVGTPVVSLFAPVVPATVWAPHGQRVVVLGDQQAPCAGSRARRCPVEGHPCLSSVAPATVVDAVVRLGGFA